MRRYLKYELDITFDNKQRVKELTVTERNLTRMNDFKKQNKLKYDRIKKLVAEIQQQKKRKKPEIYVLEEPKMTFSEN